MKAGNSWDVAYIPKANPKSLGIPRIFIISRKEKIPKGMEILGILLISPIKQTQEMLGILWSIQYTYFPKEANTKRAREREVLAKSVTALSKRNRYTVISGTLESLKRNQEPLLSNMNLQLRSAREACKEKEHQGSSIECKPELFQD